MALAMAKSETADLAQETPAVSLRHISKWFGSIQVLNDVSLDVRTGERIVICGPSGSGKSTLIRCINRLENFQKGEIVVDGAPLSNDPKSITRTRRHIGMVFQHFNLYPHLSVLENCTLSPMRALKTKKADAIQLARQYLVKVKLSDHEHKLPGQLSGGQQQRVAIARALCMRPKVMLFDEPTSALDPELVREVLDTIVELAGEGMTMICVTHEMGFARKLADRIIFMDRGSIIESAPPAEFFESSKNERVRIFLNQLSHHEEEREENRD